MPSKRATAKYPSLAQLEAVSKATLAKIEARKTRALIEKPLPPDPDEQNDARASWAAEALDVFAKRTGIDQSEEDYQCALPDLLADLMHWCDRQPDLDCYNFTTMLALALTSYREETGA